MKALWDKLGTLYQSKSLVNKFFLWKKLYNLRMKDGDSVTDHMNAFNTVVSQLSSIDIKISYEDNIEIICTKHPYFQDPPDLTLITLCKILNLFHLLIFCGKINCIHM